MDTQTLNANANDDSYSSITRKQSTSFLNSMEIIFLMHSDYL